MIGAWGYRESLGRCSKARVVTQSHGGECDRSATVYLSQHRGSFHAKPEDKVPSGPT